MEHPRIRAYINARFGDDAPRWPFEWFESWCRGRVFRRALSIGSGAGTAEVDLIRRGLCETVDAFDSSFTALSMARNAAMRDARVGSRVRYFAADFNRIVLPRSTYDLILFHQSLHHVTRIEHLLSQVMMALRNDGILYLDEYVGPSRTWWTPRSFRSVRRIYDALDGRFRTSRILLLPIQPDDPSEAVRSGEILSRLRIGFRIVEQRDYGGNLLSPIYPSLAPDTPDKVIDDLIEEETKVLAHGEPSFCTVIVAEPLAEPQRSRARRIYTVRGAFHRAIPWSSIYALRRFIRRIWVALDRRVRRRPIEDYV